MPKRAESQTSQNHTTMDRNQQRHSADRVGVAGLSPAEPFAGGSEPFEGSEVDRWRSSMVEQLICNQQVAGSSPIASSRCTSRTLGPLSPTRSSSLNRFGRVPEWPKGTDCKSVVSDFEGSNPSPSTSAVQGRRQSLGRFAGVAQLVELQPSKLDVAGSRPVSRSISEVKLAHVAQLAEHVLGKDEVTRSIRVVGSRVIQKGHSRGHGRAPLAGAHRGRSGTLSGFQGR